jgi:hypothetical protein
MTPKTAVKKFSVCNWPSPIIGRSKPIARTSMKIVTDVAITDPDNIINEIYISLLDTLMVKTY